MKDRLRTAIKRKRMVPGLMAAVLVLSAAAAFPAEAQEAGAQRMAAVLEAGAQGAGEQGTAAQASAVIEYAALEDLVRGSNPQVQAERADLDRWVGEYQAAWDEIMENRSSLRDEAKRLKDDGDAEGAKHYQDQARQLKDSADQLDKQIRSLNSASNTMEIRKTEDTAAMSAQDVMAAWNSLKLDLDSARAKLEAAAYKKELAGRQLGLGMGTQAEADQMEEERMAAENQVNSLEGEMEKLKRELCLLTGYDYGAQVEIGGLPAPELTRAESLDLEADKKTAWGNSYELRQQRHGGFSGTNKERHSRERSIEEGEQNMYTRLTALHRQVQSARTSCQAAESAYAAAQLDWKAAQHKMDLGAMNREEYLNAQVKYMEARAQSGQAEIDLLGAMQRYDWAVRGLILV